MKGVRRQRGDGHGNVLCEAWPLVRQPGRSVEAGTAFATQTPRAGVRASGIRFTGRNFGWRGIAGEG